MTLEKPFPLERGNVLHDRGLTREAEVFLNLARARRQPFGALFGLDEVQDVLLPGREHMNMLAKTAARARCNVGGPLCPEGERQPPRIGAQRPIPH